MEEPVSPVKVVTIVFDQEDDTVGVNWEGITYPEALGMLVRGLFMLGRTGDEDDDD